MKPTARKGNGLMTQLLSNSEAQSKCRANDEFIIYGNSEHVYLKIYLCLFCIAEGKAAGLSEVGTKDVGNNS